jgi:hypothetical protein
MAQLNSHRWLSLTAGIQTVLIQTVRKA